MKLTKKQLKKIIQEELSIVVEAMRNPFASGVPSAKEIIDIVKKSNDDDRPFMSIYILKRIQRIAMGKAFPPLDKYPREQGMKVIKDLAKEFGMNGVVNGNVDIKDPKMMSNVIDSMLIRYFDADLDTMIDMQKRNNEKFAAGVTDLDDLPTGS